MILWHDRFDHLYCCTVDKSDQNNPKLYDINNTTTVLIKKVIFFDETGIVYSRGSQSPYFWQDRNLFHVSLGFLIYEMMNRFYKTMVTMNELSIGFGVLDQTNRISILWNFQDLISCEMWKLCLLRYGHDQYWWKHSNPHICT